jgi:hypothetical protein
VYWVLEYYAFVDDIEKTERKTCERHKKWRFAIFFSWHFLFSAMGKD